MKNLSILSYLDMIYESGKLVLNTFVGYGPYHESHPFSINDVEDVTANLTSVTAAIPDPKYHMNSNKPVIWLWRFMKAHKADYVKVSYLEGIHFKQDRTTDVSLKQRLWLLRLQDEKPKKTQQSLALHRKVLKEGSSNLERNTTPQPAYEAPDTKHFCYASPARS